MIYSLFFKHILRLVVFVGVSLYSSLIYSASSGHAVYQKLCVACHGMTGQGNSDLNAPLLSGQSVSYLERSLLNFKNGMRGTHTKDSSGAQMVVIAKQLDASEIKKVSLWLSEQVAAKNDIALAVPTSTDIRKGNNLYHGNCGACHGGHAEGNERLKAPRLTGLSFEYLKRQMVNFKQGVRGSHPDDKPGKQMALMANTIDQGKALDDVLAYIIQLMPTQK